MGDCIIRRRRNSGEKESWTIILGIANRWGLKREGLRVWRSWIFISLSNVDFDMSVEPLQYILIKQTLTQIPLCSFKYKHLFWNLECRYTLSSSSKVIVWLSESYLPKYSPFLCKTLATNPWAQSTGAPAPYSYASNIYVSKEKIVNDFVHKHH